MDFFKRSLARSAASLAASRLRGLDRVCAACGTLYTPQTSGQEDTHSFLTLFDGELRDVLPVNTRPCDASNSAMWERTLGVTVCLPSSIVLVVCGIDVSRVESIDELDLVGSESTAVDGKPMHLPPWTAPQRPESSLDEDHSASPVSSEVEE